METRMQAEHACVEKVALGSAVIALVITIRRVQLQSHVSTHPAFLIHDGHAGDPVAHKLLQAHMGWAGCESPH
eukprot:1152408-Pelagomonas_calceolata.AAC.2